MNKIALQELMYDIERTKDWDKIHTLIIDYAKVEVDISENIFDDFDDELWEDFTNSIEHGEILDKELFFVGLYL